MNNTIDTTGAANETTVTETAVVAKAKRSYPFRSKADIIAQVKTDGEFMLHCLGVLYDRQTTDEQDNKDTKYKNARGFMSSHAVNGSILAQKVRSGEQLSDEETAKAEGIVVRYGKQLAEHFRSERLAQDPTLASTAALFGV